MIHKRAGVDRSGECESESDGKLDGTLAALRLSWEVVGGNRPQSPSSNPTPTVRSRKIYVIVSIRGAFDATVDGEVMLYGHSHRVASLNESKLKVFAVEWL